MPELTPSRHGSIPFSMEEKEDDRSVRKAVGEAQEIDGYSGNGTNKQ